MIDLERCDEAIAASETALRLAPDLYEARVNFAGPTGVAAVIAKRFLRHCMRSS
jgi:hypothetical protein